ncbi:hypothetical protein UPYG_G00116440 [Umbra pygmaea]|uniref:Ig-like domain-containing protein n=1 Tax=Umbra pygmaea TaxID=75934 RepID=A0ABD0X3X7_UMBPY
MGLMRSSRSPLILIHLFVTTLAGGILFFCLYCDGANLPNPTQSTHRHEVPLTKTIAVTALSEAGTVTENTSLFTDVLTDVPVEEEGLAVQQQPDREKAMAGDNVIFTCYLSGGDPEVVSVQWEVRGHRNKNTVLEGNRTSVDGFAGRAFLSGNPSAGDFSMILRNVSSADRGVYHCILISHNGSTVEGSGTKLSIREVRGQDESVGTLLGLIVAGVEVRSCSSGGD